MKKNILFVDDDLSILNGLKRSLRSTRKEWNNTFASSGHEALNIMEEHAFDAIVSDMRMPEMDGSELLEKVKNRFPWIVRIVLSGHSGPLLTLSSVSSSHRYLSKPCDAEHLKSTLKDIFSLQQEVKNKNIRSFITSLQLLPSNDENIERLQKMLSVPSPNVHEIGELIALDPAMTAVVIRLVSSAYFGVGQKPLTAAGAVQTLGITTIKSLMDNGSLAYSSKENHLLDRKTRSIIGHAQKVAELASEICQHMKINGCLAQRAYASGILHNIGYLISACYQHNEESNASSRKVSQSNLDHEAIGRYFLGLWGIQGDLLEAVSHQRSLSKLTLTTLTPTTAVHVANTISYLETTNLSLKEKLKLTFSNDQLEILQLHKLVTEASDKKTTNPIVA